MSKVGRFFTHTAWVALLALLTSGVARADGEMASLKVAMPILLKVLTYDQNFDSRGFGEFVVLVVSESAQQGARDQVLDVLKNLSVTRVKNRPLKFVAGEFKDGPSLDAEVLRTKAGAILVVPGVSSSGVGFISEIAQDNQIYSLALEAPMVEQAIAVGVTQSGGRPQIII
ncbi:MAG: hypothetical protein ACYC8T_28670, partial [Myxococcaceae bacterium]